MTRDTFDMFDREEPGRFGDHEHSSRRVTGASDLIDLSMLLHHQTANAILVSSTGEESRAVWIPKSQCEFVETGRYSKGTRKNGSKINLAVVTVTCTQRVAEEKQLI